MKLKNKKATHVEEIISFVFFLTFVFFLVFFLKYPNSNSNLKSTLDSFEISVNNQTAENIMKVYITNTSTKTSENCIMINESYLGTSSINVSVKGSDGSDVSSKRDSGKLYIEWNSEKSFFVAYYSKYNFSSAELSGTLTCQNGNVKAVISNNIFIEQKITEFLNKIASNYSKTRDLLGISSKYDYNVQFDYNNKTRIGKNIKDVNEEIYVREKLVEYLDTNANEKTGKIIIYIW